VRSFMIVFPSPLRKLLFGIRQREEQMQVQALVSQFAIEALNVSVLYRPTGPDVTRLFRARG